MTKTVCIIVVAVCAVLAFVAGVLLTDARGFSARDKPGVMESWVARRARKMTLPSGVTAQVNASADSTDVIAEARAHWADHCAVCHANNGSGDTEMGKHFYPPAPDMRAAETQNLTDGELFYIIQNGVRWTGMPAWGNGTERDAEDSWKLVRFIRHLPKLTPEEEKQMEALNPKSPDELKEEQEEKDFLSGGEIHEQEHQHHH